MHVKFCVDLGVSATATIVANKAKGKDRKKRKFDNGTSDQPGLKTYIGQINISGRHVNITLTPNTWTVNGEPHSWRIAEAVTASRTKIVTDGLGNMIAVVFPNRITLLVMRHMRSRSQVRAGKVPFMGFYIVDDRGFSWYTHGLLGMSTIMWP